MKLLICIILFFILLGFTSSQKIASDCTCEGIKLYGNVKIVDSFEDFRVEFVDSFEDLDVQFVDAFPDECGKWRLVETFPDFTIKIVDAFPDFTIRKVEAFPGIK